MEMTSAPTRSTAVLPFKHPFTAICCGSPGSGKTLFVLRLVQNMETMIEPPPKSTVYYFMEYQSVFDEYPQIDFRQGVPTVRELEEARDTDRVRRHDDGIERRPTQRFYARFAPSTELRHTHRAKFVQFQQKHENYEPQCTIPRIF